jgi:hypothetical protein
MPNESADSATMWLRVTKPFPEADAAENDVIMVSRATPRRVFVVREIVADDALLFAGIASGDLELMQSSPSTASSPPDRAAPSPIVLPFEIRAGSRGQRY